ncbi:hypothetical protein K438DRAFT_1822538 [Mycena galopus ATCC 62051]|nr:hypothetical protein K438DRAFT_1822538 [Mycena galopus ATCC 62051]
MNSWGPNPWGPPAFYQQPGFAAPPQQGFPGYWGQPGWAPPNPNPGFSAKYPNLHPILASDSTQVRFDVRRKAQHEIPPVTYTTVRGLFATASSSAHIRLISKAFPWTIDIVSKAPVTIEAVWDALHIGLQQPILDSEWGFIIGDKKLRESIEKAAKKRADSDNEPGLKRIDWLGGNTIFKGLDRIEDFAELRLLPGTEPCTETWVVKLGSS